MVTYLPLLAFVLHLSISTCPADRSNLPESKEATLIEVISPTDWGLEATGIGRGREKGRQENAITDAKKAAIWFILFGQDGLVQTEGEREKIKQCMEPLFEKGITEGFVTWIGRSPLKRVVIEGGKALKVVVQLRVNRKMVGDWLVDHCGFAPPPARPPSILVLPEVPDRINRIRSLHTDELMEAAATVIVSFLSYQGYESFIPEPHVNGHSEKLKITSEIQDDYALMLATAYGVDIYVSYNVEIEKRNVGRIQSNKAIVRIQASDAAMGRPIADETGYSEFRPSPEMVVLEEAMTDAIGKVSARINRYWKEEWEKGLRYRVIFHVECEDFDQQQTEVCTATLSRVLEHLFPEVNVNVTSDHSSDYVIRAQYADFENARDIYRAIKKSFSEEFSDGLIVRDVLNRKLLVAKVTCAGE